MTEAEAVAKLEAWKASGLPMGKWAAQNGGGLGSMRHWQAEIERRAVSTPVPVPATPVAVRLDARDAEVLANLGAHYRATRAGPQPELPDGRLEEVWRRAMRLWSYGKLVDHRYGVTRYRHGVEVVKMYLAIFRGGGVMARRFPRWWLFSDLVPEGNAIFESVPARFRGDFEYLRGEA